MIFVPYCIDYMYMHAIDLDIIILKPEQNICYTFHVHISKIENYNSVLPISCYVLFTKYFCLAIKILSKMYLFFTVIFIQYTCNQQCIYLSKNISPNIKSECLGQQTTCFDKKKKKMETKLLAFMYQVSNTGIVTTFYIIISSIKRVFTVTVKDNSEN